MAITFGGLTARTVSVRSAMVLRDDISDVLRTKVGVDEIFLDELRIRDLVYERTIADFSQIEKYLHSDPDNIRNLRDFGLELRSGEEYTPQNIALALYGRLTDTGEPKYGKDQPAVLAALEDLSSVCLRNTKKWNESMSGFSGIIDFSGLCLRGMRFDGINLIGANLAGANLMGTHLSYGNLNGADLSRANLTGADLIGTILRGANFTQAVTIGANFVNAKCAGAIGLDSLPIAVSKEFTALSLLDPAHSQRVTDVYKMLRIPFINTNGILMAQIYLRNSVDNSGGNTVADIDCITFPKILLDRLIETALEESIETAQILIRAVRTIIDLDWPCGAEDGRDEKSTNPVSVRLSMNLKGKKPEFAYEIAA
ncbi:MAG: pentapeptide repeat-containing protein [Candidatus Margulisiibacteriota bacterium]